MRKLMQLLQREPAAAGSLVASILPLLVLLGVVRIDEAGIAAVVVAVNTFVGFGVRLVVAPTASPVPVPVPAAPAQKLTA